MTLSPSYITLLNFLLHCVIISNLPIFLCSLLDSAFFKGRTPVYLSFQPQVIVPYRMSLYMFMKSEKQTEKSSDQPNHYAKGPRNRCHQESCPSHLPDHGKQFPLPSLGAFSRQCWGLMIEIAHQSSFSLCSLPEILVLKFPKHHQPKAWLRQTHVPKGGYHTLSCLAQTKATNKEAALYCLSPVPLSDWPLLYLYPSPSPSFG